jgi:hypothetical protein
MGARSPGGDVALPPARLIAHRWVLDHSHEYVRWTIAFPCGHGYAVLNCWRYTMIDRPFRHTARMIDRVAMALANGWIFHLQSTLDCWIIHG